MNEKWWKEGIAYQVYVRSFKDGNGDGIGDLEGIRQKLGYLKDLGIDIIYFNPINKSPNDDNGYDISDFRDIMDEFGGLEEFERLLEEIHATGLKLVMDLVINHSSDEHPWFEEACKSKDNPYHDYYIWQDGKEGEPPNNWGSFFGGSAWEYVEELGQYYLHLFSRKQPDFNWRNKKLRNEMMEVIKFWTVKGVDGFRMDAINHIEKDHSFPDGKIGDGQIYGDFIKYVQNLPEVHGYLKEIRKEALDLNKDLVLIGETGGISYDTAFVYTGIDRGELDMTFHFDMHSVGRGKVDWEREPIQLIEDVKEKLSGWQIRPDQEGWCPIYYSNHDTTRTVSRLGDDKKYWDKSAKMLALLQLTSKGTPFIYNGDEIGMTNAYDYGIEDYDDVSVKNKYKDFVESGKITHDQYVKGLHLTARDNSRTPMQWSDKENGGFSETKPWIKLNENYKEINVKAQLKNQDSILHFYKRMIKLRKEHPTFTYGVFKELAKEHKQIYAYIREDGEARFMMMINFFGNVASIELSEVLVGELNQAIQMIGNYQRERVLEKTMCLRPYEALVYKLGDIGSK